MKLTQNKLNKIKQSFLLLEIRNHLNKNHSRKIPAIISSYFPDVKKGCQIKKILAKNIIKGLPSIGVALHKMG
jgi:hypothetical protein